MDRIWNFVRKRPATSLAIVTLTGFGFLAISSLGVPTPPVYVAARLVPSSSTDNVLEVHVWHQHTGNLKNGKVSVIVRGKTWQESRIWTFETWPPNPAGVAILTIKGNGDKLQEPLTITVFAYGNDAYPHYVDYHCQLKPGESRTLRPR
jgi:hypothetical protein